MGQFKMASVGIEPAAFAPSRRETWLLLDVAMTLVMLALTSIYVGTLAMSLG